MEPLMNTLLKLLTIFLAVSFSSLVSAKIYQWKDANGVMQFTQTPPPKQAGKKTLKVKEVKLHSSSSNLYDRNGDLCGILSRKKVKGDQLGLLRELRMNMKYWKESAINFTNERNTVAKRGGTAGGLQNIQNNIDNMTCIVNWGKKKISQLEPLRLEYLDELARVEKEYATLKETNPSVKALNKKWRELKKLRARKSGLVRD